MINDWLIIVNDEWVWVKFKMQWLSMLNGYDNIMIDEWVLVISIIYNDCHCWMNMRNDNIMTAKTEQVWIMMIQWL